jgi:hypothetical protein
MSQTTIKGRPVFVAGMETDACGMLKVSLVDYPAVEKNFLAFDKQEKVELYAVQDEDKQIVRGVLMRANYPIFRKDKELGEYFIIYKPETIREMAEQYLKDGRSSNVNLMHEDGSDVEGVDMVQMFIKDSAAGVNPSGFEEIEDGSLFAEFHVNNPDVWASIKAGTYKGFSIETLNTIEEENAVISTEKIQDVLDWLNSFSSNNMNVKNQIKAKLAAMLGKFGNVVTDKATLSWDGDGELEAGMEVYILDEDGNRQKPEDGDYTTEDGKVIAVADGIVTEIRDKEAEVAPEGEENDMKAQKMATLAKFEESYEEKERKIAEAIAAANGEGFYFYIVEAGEGYAVICWWTDDDLDNHYRKYEVSFDEEGNAVLGESVEGRMGFIPDEAAPAAEPEPAPAEEDETMANAMSAVLDEIKTIKAEMATLKGQPAAQPAHEEFKSEGALKANVPDKRFEKFAQRFSN